MTARLRYRVWAASRFVLLVMLVLPRVGGHRLFGDVHLYRVWATGIVHWTRVPYRDFGWEYPPAAAILIAPPGVVASAYSFVFVCLMVVLDLVMTIALSRLAARLGSDRGVWLWLVGVLLLGPIAFARYDTFASLLAVLAVLGIAAGMPLAAGIALGGGIAAKLWPAVLLLVTPFVRGWRRMLVATGATVLAFVLLVLAIGGAKHGGAMFTKHTTRGLQVESIAATPLVVAERAGADVTIAAHPLTSGSWDLSGTGVQTALDVTAILSAMALLLIGALLLRVRGRPGAWLDLPATALLLLTVTDKVLSPQYELWLLGVLAAALCRKDSVLVPAALLVAASAALTPFVFPMFYLELVRGHGLVVVGVLATRNALLLAATVVAVVRLWRAPRTATP